MVIMVIIIIIIIIIIITPTGRRVTIQNPESASADAMRKAMAARFALSDMSTRDIFDKIDIDGSGELDKEETAQAAEMLGMVIDESNLDETFDEIDTDGSGAISFFEFQRWWLNEKSRKPPQFWAVRSFSYKEKVPKGEKAPPQVDDLCICEIQALIEAGTIGDETLIYCDEFSNFLALKKCRKIKELAQALDAAYCEKLHYQIPAGLQGGGNESAEVSVFDLMKLIRDGTVNEDTKVRSADTVRQQKGGGGVTAMMAALKMFVPHLQPLSEVKHVFGLADYMPVAFDMGGVVNESNGGETAAKMDDLAKSMEASFAKSSWKGGTDGGTAGGKKLRGMNATSKKAAKRMKKRAAKLLNSDKAIGE